MMLNLVRVHRLPATALHTTIACDAFWLFWCFIAISGPAWATKHGTAAVPSTLKMYRIPGTRTMFGASLRISSSGHYVFTYDNEAAIFEVP
jgi:hypothetical protein